VFSCKFEVILSLREPEFSILAFQIASCILLPSDTNFLIIVYNFCSIFGTKNKPIYFNCKA